MYQLRQAAPIQPGGLRTLREQGSGGAQIQRGELPRAVQALQQVQRRQYVGLQARTCQYVWRAAGDAAGGVEKR